MRTDAIASPVPLEDVHAVLAHELQASLLEPSLVSGVKQIEVACFGNEPHFSGMGGSLLVSTVTT